MKNTKKIISVLLSLAMIVAMFAVVATIPASAAAGDTWTEVYNSNTNWKYNLKSINNTSNSTNCPNSKVSLTTSPNPMYTIDAGVNSGTSLWQRYILVYLAGTSAMYLKSNTRYQVSFEVSSQGVSIDKYGAELTYFDINVSTNNFPTDSNSKIISDKHTDLTPYATQTAWGEYLKYNVTLTYDAPASLPTYPMLALSVYHKQSQSKPIYISHITFTEVGSYKTVSIVDEDTGATLGSVHAMVGDDVYELLDVAGCTSDVDYTYTTSPATISTLTDTITLTKTLKTNIAQKINFGSDEYLGNSNDTNGHYYSKVEGNKKLIKQETSIKGEGVNVGADFGNRSIVLANNRLNSGLVAGNTYRINLKFNSWYALSNFGLQVKFGRGVWNTIQAGAETYTGNDFTDLITTLRPLTNEQSGNYLITLDVTLPETEDWGSEAYKNIIISLYGTGSNTVEYWLTTAYIYKKTTATVTNNDGSFTATVLGFEGDSISSPISDDGSAKFLGLTDSFGFENKTVRWDTIILRGDADANFIINDADYTLLVDYLFEKPEAAGADLFGLNVIYGTGNEDIDICDLVALEMKLESE